MNGSQAGAMIYDNSGNPVWFQPVNTSLANLQPITYLGQPALAFFVFSCATCFSTGQWIVLNNHYQQIALISPGNGYIADSHALEISPDGTKVLLDVYNPVIYDMTPLGGPRDATVVEAVVQELDLATGQVDFEWHSLGPGANGQPNVPVTDSEVGLNTAPVDYIHVNSLAYDTDGNILFSARHTSTVYKVDYQTGALLWHFGGKRNQFTFTDGDGGPSFAHDVQVRGNGTISMFDNGVTRSPSYSRGVVWAVDESALTAQVVQQWRHSPDLFGFIVGSNRLLPNGDQLISWGSTGYVSEFSPSGAVDFNSQLQAGVWTYRTLRVNGWHATPATPPALAVSRPAPTQVSVAASWNGATDVAQWQLWGGPSFSQLRQLTSVPRSGFETVIPATVLVTDHVFQVRAIDSGGTTLGVSGNAGDALQQKYQSMGGASSFLGAAVGGTFQVGSGLGQNYANGAIYWSASSGAWSVHGAILQHYLQVGGPTGILGFPITDETGTPDGVGRYNHFQQGSMYWTPTTGAHEVNGAIANEWAALNWEKGVLGYPTTDETSTPDGVGRYNHFQQGSVYWTFATGAHEVHGAIANKWAALGWERSFLGYPVTDEFTPLVGFRQNNFQHGSIRWNAATGATTVF
jgi:hypothetical protein